MSAKRINRSRRVPEITDPSPEQEAIYAEVGEALLSFLEKKGAGLPVHPELEIVELRIGSHEIARRCFAILEMIDAVDEAMDRAGLSDDLPSQLSQTQ
jgi:hypothetical protein